MTFGTVIIDSSPVRYYYRRWNGQNWGSPLKPISSQEGYWRLEKGLNEATDSLGDHLDSPEGFARFVKVAGKKRLPRRAKIEDHPYTTYTYQYFQYNGGVEAHYDNNIPHDLLEVVNYNFVDRYGVGYSGSGASQWDENDRISLIGKLREKVVGSDFDMSVFLGEGREALSMIATNANRIYSYLRGLLKLDARQMSRALGVDQKRVEKALRRGRGRGKHPALILAEINLELQYGWLPLLKDAHGAAQALAQQLNYPAVQTYRVRRRKNYQLAPISTNINTYTFVGLATQQYIARLTEVNKVALNGLADPASVLWEKTPWSFVADWFIPIGNYLSARGLANAVTGTFVYTVSYREKFEANSGNVHGNPWIVSVVQPWFTSSAMSTTRTVTSSMIVPLPSFKPLGEVLSWRRAGNAVSLVTALAFRLRS